MNVGGHRRFRPSVLAKDLWEFGVVNVGAAGTFVVRRPGSRAAFRAELLRRLPFETQIVLCDGRDLLRLEKEHPFRGHAPERDVVRFVSILTRARARVDVPISLPDEEKWLVRVLAVQGRFVFGMYRRHMKTIGCLGRLDRLLGVPVTTRNLNTILRIVEILKRGTSA